MKVSNIQEKSLNRIALEQQCSFLINTVQKRGNTNAEREIMQISQTMKTCDWLININRNIDQNQSGATGGKHAYFVLSFFFCKLTLSSLYFIL